MSEKKSIYVNGVRFFKPNENAPENLVANVLITPKLLGESLRQDDVKDAKGEYQGNEQYRATLWKNSDGSYSMSFNTYKAESKVQQAEESGDDLPF
jgi:hypothetical protein